MSGLRQSTSNKHLRVAVVTGSRADYGLLYTIMRAIDADPTLELQIVVTGMHLSPEFGYTVDTIKADGFSIDAKVECLLSGDSAVATAKSMGLGTIGFADTLNSLTPDLLLVLGDRFEVFAAVQTALILNIPVAHIAGGDTTEGAFDESLRHSITKMSHLHFATNAQAAHRIRQMGENPAHIFIVGSPGIDLIRQTPLLSKAQLQSRLDTILQKKLLLVAYHPTTLESADLVAHCNELLSALDEFQADCSVVITKTNADTGGRTINQLITQYAHSREHVTVVSSLGQQLFYSAIAAADVMVGNSSSGLYEAPTFKTPSVNIGDRQKGRLKASSVLDCAHEKTAIVKAVRNALSMDCSDVVNPYGDGHATQNIMVVLQKFADKQRLQALLKKQFHPFPNDR